LTFTTIATENVNRSLIRELSRSQTIWIVDIQTLAGLWIDKRMPWFREHGDSGRGNWQEQHGSPHGAASPHYLILKTLRKQKNREHQPFFTT